ncbi:ABC transporter permease [Shouchella clausii]|jgi:peptide/nickel transport system permease protein|uniref:Peptide ABC transporter permease n=1 Tax=Shouchella clausii TaxID=79880 RepID=A0A268RVG6_SHOCL|nr:oligopeptide ABC transporter permease [Shouchella clausii]PAD41050.1 peptide ABC transporter permease [Bacillus sp. 7520-S]MCY1105239.1 ABC transporter permease [Shouchella clausii]MED4158424.1 ABC transporter permease [Shouchella clausii]MED4177625.1 ABC transporter permease [Shouchella clausii]PAE97046.1 peptide ABC transporter permease [Shouchella clausii]
MWKFILRRTVVAIPQIFMLSILVFFIASFMPGDPFSGQIDPNVSPERLEELREMYGLNDPWYQQYGRWLANVAQGDFGDSFRFKMPVVDLIGDRFWNTAGLGILTLVFSYMLAIPMGIVSGRYNDSWLDRGIAGYTYVGFAMPSFIFGLIALFIFGYQFRIFPTGGSVTPGLEPGTFQYILSKIYHMLLPALSLALLTIANTVQYLRSEVIDTKHKEFVLTAKAKGASENRLYNRHILRNSFLPVAAFLGYEITGVLAGAVFIERVFSFPGLGDLLISSILQRDYSVVTALLLLTGVLAIIGTMLSDIILSIVDPRIRIR